MVSREAIFALKLLLLNTLFIDLACRVSNIASDTDNFHSGLATTAAKSMAVLKRARKNLNRKTDRDRTQTSSTPQPETRICNSNWRKKPSEQPAQCAYQGCGKILSSSGNAKMHYQSQHTGPRSRVESKYPGCNATFMSKVPMEYHYRVQHLGQPRNPTNRRTQCNFPGCGRIFSSLENQQYHSR